MARVPVPVSQTVGPNALAIPFESGAAGQALAAGAGAVGQGLSDLGGQMDDIKAREVVRMARMARLDSRQNAEGTGHGQIGADALLGSSETIREDYNTQVDEWMDGLSPGARNRARAGVEAERTSFASDMTATEGAAWNHKHNIDFAEEIDSLILTAADDSLSTVLVSPDTGELETFRVDSALASIDAAIDRHAGTDDDESNEGFPHLLDDSPIPWAKKEKEERHGQVHAKVLKALRDAGDPGAATLYLERYGDELTTGTLPEETRLVRAASADARIETVFQEALAQVDISVYGGDGEAELNAVMNYVDEAYADDPGGRARARAFAEQQGGQMLRRQRAAQEELYVNMHDELVITGGDIFGLQTGRRQEWEALTTEQQEALIKTSVVMDQGIAESEAAATYGKYVEMAYKDRASFTQTSPAKWWHLPDSQRKELDRLHKAKPGTFTNGALAKAAFEALPSIGGARSSSKKYRERLGRWMSVFVEQVEGRGGDDQVDSETAQQILGTMSREILLDDGWVWDTTEPAYQIDAADFSITDIPAQHLAEVKLAIAPMMRPDMTPEQVDGMIREIYVRGVRGGIWEPEPEEEGSSRPWMIGPLPLLPLTSPP